MVVSRVTSYDRESDVSAVALSDVTAEGVEHAMVEFNRPGREVFLA